MRLQDQEEHKKPKEKSQDQLRGRHCQWRKDATESYLRFGP